MSDGDDLNFWVVVQARMNSRRCPGKVMRPVEGKPLLGYLVDRLADAGLAERLVVATSTLTANDCIEAYCKERQIFCYRGSEADVASRFAELFRKMDCDWLVRVSGDSPMFDPALVEAVLALAAEDPDADLISNVVQRTYPKGQSVELLSRASFVPAYEKMSAPGDLEHVTPFFYRNADEYKIISMTNSDPCGGVSMVVDTEDEFEQFARFAATLNDADWRLGWQELLALRQVASECA